jgi:tetratricopeptide (TPR) repeat protein
LNGLVLEYRDPLFGVIVLIAVIFTIGVFSHFWGLFQTKKSYKQLDDFLGTFSLIKNSPNELDYLLNTPNIPTSVLLELAHSYEHIGDYANAMIIYQYVLLSKISKEIENDVLLKMAINYFYAGFLERSEKTLLQILRKNPRTAKALKYLLLIYEKMHNYRRAVETLEPLNILNNDTQLDYDYLKVLSILNQKISIDDKKDLLLNFYNTKPYLKRIILEFFFVNYPLYVQKMIIDVPLENIVDLLWTLPKDKIDYEIVDKHLYLQELFTARGILNKIDHSDIFEFNILIKLQNRNECMVNLEFEYLCKSCKQIFPVSFHRCHNCLEIDTQICQINLVKENDETYYSF